MLARLSRMSYVDVFALFYGSGDGLRSAAPRHVRQATLEVENPHPSGRNVLYFHIPFCVSRCQYCPYYLHPYSPLRARDYLAALELEAAMVSETPYVKSTRFWCVYLGGGTASVLKPHELERLASTIRRCFRLTADVEMTFEANPATLTRDKIRRLRALGFNRVSLGVQTFNDVLLRQLHCAHTGTMARKAMAWVGEMGLVLNVDLLFGLAGQTDVELEQDLQQSLMAGPPPHLTLFPLRIAAGTPLANDLARSHRPDSRTHQQHLLHLDRLAEKRLTEHSYQRAESPISYCLDGVPPHRYQSVEGRVLGLGAGAGSVLEQGESLNHRDVERYIRDLGERRWPVQNDLPCTPDQARERYVLFQILFMNRSRPGFRDRVTRHFEAYYHERIGLYYDRVLEDLRRRGYVEVMEGRIQIAEPFWNKLAGLEIGTPSIL
jgi:oxygen-independent coproporphyrinogen-3 oxidase